VKGEIVRDVNRVGHVADEADGIGCSGRIFLPVTEEWEEKGDGERDHREEEDLRPMTDVEAGEVHEIIGGNHHEKSGPQPGALENPGPNTRELHFNEGCDDSNHGTIEAKNNDLAEDLVESFGVLDVGVEHPHDQRYGQKQNDGSPKGEATPAKHERSREKKQGADDVEKLLEGEGPRLAIEIRRCPREILQEEEIFFVLPELNDEAGTDRGHDQQEEIIRRQRPGPPAEVEVPDLRDGEAVLAEHLQQAMTDEVAGENEQEFNSQTTQPTKRLQPNWGGLNKIERMMENDEENSRGAEKI